MMLLPLLPAALTIFCPFDGGSISFCKTFCRICLRRLIDQLQLVLYDYTSACMHAAYWVDRIMYIFDAKDFVYIKIDQYQGAAHCATTAVITWAYASAM